MTRSARHLPKPAVNPLSGRRRPTAEGTRIGSVFPVVDTVAPSAGHASCRSYFNIVKGTWEATGEDVRQRLDAELTRLVEETGSPPNKAFPVVNKIVELTLIGRNHSQSR